jgi:hypothetical protein
LYLPENADNESNGRTTGYRLAASWLTSLQRTADAGRFFQPAAPGVFEVEFFS